MTSPIEYAVLPVTVRRWASPCGSCGGTGVTGDRFEVPTDTGPVLLCDVICPACGGCGNGGDHLDCAADMHASADEPDDGLSDELAELDDEMDDRERCPSCGTGRGWNAVQGFPAEPDDDDEIAMLRVPCGCAADRLVRGTDPGELISVVISA